MFHFNTKKNFSQACLYLQQSDDYDPNVIKQHLFTREHLDGLYQVLCFNHKQYHSELITALPKIPEFKLPLLLESYILQKPSNPFLLFEKLYLAAHSSSVKCLLLNLLAKHRIPTNFEFLNTVFKLHLTADPADFLAVVSALIPLECSLIQENISLVLPIVLLNNGIDLLVLIIDFYSQTSRLEEFFLALDSACTCLFDQPENLLLVLDSDKLEAECGKIVTTLMARQAMGFIVQLTQFSAQNRIFLSRILIAFCLNVQVRNDQKDDLNTLYKNIWTNLVEGFFNPNHKAKKIKLKDDSLAKLEILSTLFIHVKLAQHSYYYWSLTDQNDFCKSLIDASDGRDYINLLLKVSINWHVDMSLEPDLKKLGKLWKTYQKFDFIGYPNLSSLSHLPGLDVLNILKYHFESLRSDGFPQTPHFYEIRSLRNNDGAYEALGLLCYEKSKSVELDPDLLICLGEFFKSCKKIELKEELIRRVCEGETKPFESFFLFKYGNIKSKIVLGSLWESEEWYSFALQNLDKSRVREIIRMHLDSLDQENIDQLKMLFQRHHDIIGPKIGALFSFKISHALIEKLLNSNIKITVEQFSLLLSAVADDLNNDILYLLITCKPKKVERNIHIFSQMLVMQTEKTSKTDQVEMDKLMRIYNRLSKLNITKHAGFLLLDLLKVGNVHQEFIFYCLDACDKWQRSCAMALTDSKEELSVLLEKWDKYRYKGKN